MSDYQLPPLDNEKKFEELICDLFNAHKYTGGYIIVDYQLSGKSGQEQKGTDIFSSSDQVVIQCKKKDVRTSNDKKLRSELLKDIEVNCAKAFTLDIPFNRFILASTFKDDFKIQEYANKLKLKRGYRFEIHYIGWNTIERLLLDHPNLVKKYYPSIGYSEKQTELIGRKLEGYNREFPTYQDLLKDIEFDIIYKNEDVINRICQELILENRFVIKGAEGRGKTVLASLVAFRLYRKHHLDVRFLDLREYDTNEFNAAAKRIIQIIKDYPLLLVLENLHKVADYPFLDAFLNNIIDGSRISKGKILLTSREIESEYQIDLGDWSKHLIHEMKPDLLYAKKIIQKVIPEQLSEKYDQWINSEFGGESDINLRRLGFYLKAWEEQEEQRSAVPLYDIGEDHIINYIKKFYDKDLRKAQLPKHVFHYMTILGRIAAVFQFDTPYYATEAEVKQYDLYTVAERTKLIALDELGRKAFKMQHATDARYLVAVLDTNWQQKTISLLKSYICRNNSLVSNYLDLFRGIAKQNAYEITDALLDVQEIYEALLVEITKNGLRKLSLLIGYLNDELKSRVWFDYLGRIKKEDFKKEIIHSEAVELAVLFNKVVKFDSSIIDILRNDILKIKAEQIDNLVAITSFYSFLPKTKFTYFLDNIQDKDIKRIIDSNPNKDNLLERITRLPDAISDKIVDFIVPHINKTNLNLIELKNIFNRLRRIGKHHLIKTLIDNIGTNTLVNLINQEVDFGNIHTFLFPLPLGNKKELLSEIDYLDLGHKAIDCKNPWHFIFFSIYLDFVSRENVLEFYKAMGDENIARHLKYVDYFSQNRTLTQIETVDTNSYQKVIDNLYYAEPRTEEDINQLHNRIFHYRWNSPDSHTKIDDMLELLNPMKILEVSHQPNALSIFGRILNSFSKVSLNNNQKEQLQIVANNIAKVVVITQELGKLSMLNYNISTFSKEAHKELTYRIYKCIDLESHIKPEIPLGLMSLLKQYKNHNLNIATLEEKLFSLDLAQIIDKCNLITLNNMLWELLQINPQQLRHWYQLISPNKWLNKIHTTKDRDILFWLCLNLYHINEESAAFVTHDIWKKCYEKSTKITAFDIPLIGFLNYHTDFKYNGRPFASYKLADYLANGKMSLSHLAYTINLLREYYDDVPRYFYHMLSSLMYFYNPQYNIEVAKENFRIRGTKIMILGILGELNFPKEPDSTLNRMKSRLSEAVITDKDDALRLLFNPKDKKSFFKNILVAKAYLDLCFLQA